MAIFVSYKTTHKVISLLNDGTKVVFSHLVGDTWDAAVTPIPIDPLIKINGFFFGVSDPGTDPTTFEVTYPGGLSGDNVIYVSPADFTGTSGAVLDIISFGL